MNVAATLSSSDRAELFAITAADRGISPFVVEKDFWVCWTLKRLFPSISPDPDFLWKGGTTLSKVFRAISRFSEDIDLSIRRELFGDDFGDIEHMSRTKRDAALVRMRSAGRAYVRDPLLPMLRDDFAAVLGDPGAEGGWSLRIAEDDGEENPDALEFSYPGTAGQDGYVRDRVLLEFGFRAQLYPWTAHEITPYAAEAVPAAFPDGASCSVPVLDAERTFWEKATLLHSEYHRINPAPMRRMSRHYYDLAQLARSPIADAALADLGLLETVARHKRTYFHTGWARYDEARPGTLRLVPHADLRRRVELDYSQMHEMFFGDVVPFAEIIATLEELEARINAGH